MAIKPTKEPVHDDRIRLYIVCYGPCEVDERLCSINDMAVRIQCFALMFLSVGMDDLLGASKFGPGVLLRVRKLGTELLDCCLQMYNLLALTTEN